MAEVDDRDLTANRERYWRESCGEAAGRHGRCTRPSSSRGMFGWYYTRIYVQVRPERVFVWPDGDSRRRRNATEPMWRRFARVTARSRSSRTSRPRAAACAWDGRIEELGAPLRHGGARLGGPGRLPARRPPAGEHRPRQPGGSSSTAGRGPAAGGGPRLRDRPPPQPRLHMAGELPGPRRPGHATARAAWALVPHKLVGGFELPNGSQLRRLPRNLVASRSASTEPRAASCAGARLTRPSGPGTAPARRARGPAG